MVTKRKLAAELKVQTLRVDELLDAVAEAATNIVMLQKKIEELEKDHAKLKEVLENQGNELAETLSKKWDEGVSRVTNFDPFTGMNFGISVLRS